MIACRFTIALPQERLHRRSPCRSRASPSPPRKAGNLYQRLDIKLCYFKDTFSTGYSFINKVVLLTGGG